MLLIWKIKTQPLAAYVTLSLNETNKQTKTCDVLPEKMEMMKTTQIRITA